MVWTVLLSAILCCAAGVGAQEEGWTFVQGDWTLRISGKGQVESLKNGAGVELVQGAPAVYVTMALPESGGGEEKKAEKGKTYLSTLENGIEITREMTPGWPLVMNERTEFVSIAGWPVLRRTITVAPTAPPFVEAFSVAAAQRLRPGEAGAVFVPRQDGLGEIVPGEPGRAWVWGLTGLPEKVEPEQRLALPFLSEVSGDGAVRLTTLVDPGASAYFMLRPAGGSPEWVVNTESGAQPLNEPLTRTLWTVIQSGGPEEALKAWYAVALADVPPGPDWLHDIAWQHYDYMSHGGQGWFEDLDAVEKMVAPEDRGKIIFALHGWYDLLGRYTFDAAAGKLDDTWTAFPNAAAMKEKGFPTSEPVAMNQAEMHRRIKYARDRGVRVALYFADGLTACEGAGRFAEDRVLFWGGWNGPDTQGKAYCQNPAHPDVFQWYVDYLKALLAEYGQEIDALVWDETFMVRAGTLTPDAAPRKVYAAPYMMRLVKELTLATTACRKDLAFLTSDCIGATSDEVQRWLDVPPYAIMAHGTYQDSHSRPSVWPYGIFPNYRNVLWSCNWSAVTRWDYTEFGVRHYLTPLATSNGWLDDKGIARLSEEELQRVLGLFNTRKTQRQQLRWLEGPPPQFSVAAPRQDEPR